MTKFERAIAELKKLPPDRQEEWAGMILNHLEDQAHYTLTEEQVAEVERRLADKNAPTVTLEEARQRLAKYLE